MGLKHNAVALIYSFKQGKHESVRDSVSRLRQYVKRCPLDKQPSQGRLISLFLEGLRNKVLHAHLYAQKHKTFQECCLDAMDYDDNFEVTGISGVSSKSRSQDSGSTGSGAATQESSLPKRRQPTLCYNSWDKLISQQTAAKTMSLREDITDVGSVVDPQNRPM